MEFKICIFWQHFFVNTNLIKHKTFYVYIFSSGSIRIPVLLLSYSGGIDLCIVHSCMLRIAQSREFERIQKKIWRHKMSIMFNEICINEEMLYIYVCIYIYVCVCVCATHLPRGFWAATQCQILSMSPILFSATITVMLHTIPYIYRESEI